MADQADQHAELVRATIRETLVDFLDWETVYPDLGLTQAEAERDYDHLTARLVEAIKECA